MHHSGTAPESAEAAKQSKRERDEGRTFIICHGFIELCLQLLLMLVLLLSAIAVEMCFSRISVCQSHREGGEENQEEQTTMQIIIKSSL